MSFYLLLLLGCEIFESWWQHAPTLGGVLKNLARWFHTNIFLLFLMHPSFWLVLFIFLHNGMRGTLLSLILVMKGSDIAFKLWLVQKSDRGELSPDFQAMLSMPLAPWMPWVNVVFYPALLALALQN
ncbi:hypothetical protein [Hydrogenimonas sp. SS33]|uniref:hypothetical protein n=1 Tax=Hydrogenimonas leucolamina TaxID=2954236 RepID=UPI00336BFCAC